MSGLRGTVLAQDGGRVPAARYGASVYLTTADGGCPACQQPGCPGRLTHPTTAATFRRDGDPGCPCPVQARSTCRASGAPCHQFHVGKLMTSQAQAMPHDGGCPLTAPDGERAASWPVPRVGGAS